MILADLVALITFAGVLAYATFGGADYGAGIWDLLAGSGANGAARRHQIDRSIGPVWEANHVWLVFVLVFLWTGFPTDFAALVTTLFLPLALAAVGIVYRGAAFAFRKSSSSYRQAQVLGVLFAVSSLGTPFCLGAVAGAVASGRVPATGTGPWLGSWLHPTSVLGGLLAVGTCAWSAAVLLAADADRDGRPDLARWFARRALVSGVVTGVVALSGVVVLSVDAPTLAHRLRGRAAALIVVSAVAAVVAMARELRGAHRAARIPALVAVVAVVAGWGVAQYPWVLVDQTTVADTAAPRATLVALLIAFAVAGAVVVPSLVWLYRLTNRGALADEAVPGSSESLLPR